MTFREEALQAADAPVYTCDPEDRFDLLRAARQFSSVPTPHNLERVHEILARFDDAEIAPEEFVRFDAYVAERAPNEEVAVEAGAAAAKAAAEAEATAKFEAEAKAKKGGKK